MHGDAAAFSAASSLAKEWTKGSLPKSSAYSPSDQLTSDQLTKEVHQGEKL
jgi:hypothetical protein